MNLEFGLCLAGFLLGSIPFGLFVARAFGIGNIQSEGSGNIGATNVSRVLGFWPAGFLTLFLDAVKGMVFVLALKFGWIPFDHFTVSPTLLWAVGFCAVLGHCFTPWLKFNGGKGVATTYGVLLALAPFSAAVGILGFVAAFLASRIGSVGSLFGLVLAASVHFLFYPSGPDFYFFIAIVLTVIYRHEGNLRALVEKRERSF